MWAAFYFSSSVLTSDLKSPSDHNCCPSNSLPLILIDGAEWWIPGSMRIWMVVNDIKRHLCEGFINGFLAALMDAQHQPPIRTHRWDGEILATQVTLWTQNPSFLFVNVISTTNDTDWRTSRHSIRALVPLLLLLPLLFHFLVCPLCRATRASTPTD